LLRLSRQESVRRLRLGDGNVRGGVYDRHRLLDRMLHDADERIQRVCAVDQLPVTVEE